MDSDSDLKQNLTPLKEAGIPPARYDLNIHSESKSRKKPVILVIILIILLAAIGFLLFKNKSSIKKMAAGAPVSVPTPASTQTSTPVPTPPALIRSDWSFEILNGSGITGQAKKIADQIRNSGYLVIRSGNADRQTYTQTQILIKSGFKDKIDLVIADIKDIVKVASYAGELKDSTASARIIIGKDSI